MLQAIETRLARGRVLLSVPIEAADGEGQAWLYAHTEVMARNPDEDGGALFEIRIAPEQQGRVLRRFPGAEAVGSSAP